MVAKEVKWWRLWRMMMSETSAPRTDVKSNAVVSFEIAGNNDGGKVRAGLVGRDGFLERV